MGLKMRAATLLAGLVWFCFTLLVMGLPGTRAGSTEIFYDQGKIALRAPAGSGYEAHYTYGEGQQEYNFALLSDPAKARRGEKYQRFELRPGDCFPMDGWNDCEMDRERFEMSSRPRQKPAGRQCYGYSLMLADDFRDVHPTNTDLGQLHQIGGPSGSAGGLKSFPPLVQIGAKRGKLVFKWHRLTGRPDKVRDETVERTLIRLKLMKSQWTDISFCLDYEEKHIKAWVNGVEKFTIKENPVNFMPQETYFKYGIYRSFVSRYQKRAGESPRQVVFYDEVRRGPSLEAVDIHKNPSLPPLD